MTSLIDDPAPVRASDRDDAQARTSAVFSPHRLEVVSPKQQLDVVVRMLRLPNITLGEISHGAEVEVTPGRLRTYYHVNTVLAGHTRQNAAATCTPPLRAMRRSCRQTSARRCSGARTASSWL